MEENTLFGAFPTPVGRLLDRLDRMLFRDPDERATARGWQVGRGRVFARTYRDPRFDLLSACMECDGTGLNGVLSCPNCTGTGVLRAVGLDVGR